MWNRADCKLSSSIKRKGSEFESVTDSFTAELDQELGRKPGRDLGSCAKREETMLERENRDPEIGATDWKGGKKSVEVTSKEY